MLASEAYIFVGDDDVMLWANGEATEVEDLAADFLVHGPVQVVQDELCAEETLRDSVKVQVFEPSSPRNLSLTVSM